jgi:magnesium-transporting ATPase (P-type)
MVAEKTTTTANGTIAHGGVDQEKQMTRADTGNTAVSQALPFAAHTAESSKVLEALNADKANGLTEADVQKRLGVHGPNRLKPPRRPSVWSIILRQIGNAMTIVLSEFNPVSSFSLASTALFQLHSHLGQRTDGQSPQWQSRLELWTGSQVVLSLP